MWKFHVVTVSFRICALKLSFCDPLSTLLTECDEYHKDKKGARHGEQARSKGHDDSAQGRELAEDPDDLWREHEVALVAYWRYPLLWMGFIFQEKDGLAKA